ncbi:MAG: hypothetical protein KDA24_24935 [Deltaproteobacteria bacterium]|nr:hypothetical protein [Deltaproteobacteria bacterium]
MRLLLLLLVAGFAAGCGQTAASARARALDAGSFWVGPYAVRSLASGTATPEGPDVLWLADERRVMQLDGAGSAEEVWRPPKFSRLLRFEAADLDEDGVDEWVVTLDNSRIRSLVLRRADDGTFEEIAKPPGFLRPLLGPDGASWLVGQSAGAERPYSGPIKRWTMENGGLVAGDALELPGSLSLHDIHFVPQDDGHRVFTFEETGHLGERDPRSPRATLWRSDARVVARPVVVEREYGNLLNEEIEDSLALPVPTAVVDVDGDGALELLMVAGTTTPVALLDNVRVLQGGDARVMAPGARGLEERARSPLLGRAMVGVVPFELPNGAHRLAVAVWTKADGGFGKPETRVFLLDPSTGDLVGTEATPSAVEVEEEPAPAVEEEEEPAPAVEEEEEPAPAVEVEEEPAPAVEVEEEPAPAVEVEEEPAPAVEADP